MKKCSEDEIHIELKKLSGWNYNNKSIEKNFTFKDFKETLTTMVRIGFEAEALNHHPEWTNVYNKLNVRLSTHDAGGITQKDFALAKKIDQVCVFQ